MVQRRWARPRDGLKTHRPWSTRVRRLDSEGCGALLGNSEEGRPRWPWQDGGQMRSPFPRACVVTLLWGKSPAYLVEVLHCP